MGVLLLSDSSLHLIEGLFDKGTILNVKDAIGVALDLWVMSDHYACRCSVVTLSLRANPVDVENKVHDRDYNGVDKISNLFD